MKHGVRVHLVAKVAKVAKLVMPLHVAKPKPSKPLQSGGSGSLMQER